jgi:hypothetical protein
MVPPAFIPGAAIVSLWLEGVSLVVGGERRLNSFYGTCFFDDV